MLRSPLHRHRLHRKTKTLISQSSERQKSSIMIETLGYAFAFAFATKTRVLVVVFATAAADVDAAAVASGRQSQVVCFFRVGETNFRMEIDRFTLRLWQTFKKQFSHGETKTIETNAIKFELCCVLVAWQSNRCQCSILYKYKDETQRNHLENKSQAISLMLSVFWRFHFLFPFLSHLFT